MNEPPVLLLRWTRFFWGGRQPVFSCSLCRYLTALGLAGLPLFVGGLLLSPGPAFGFSIVLCLMLVTQGVSGLLREDRESLSRWFSVLYALLAGPVFYLLTGAQLYEWTRTFGAVAWAVLVVLILILVWVRRGRAYD